VLAATAALTLQGNALGQTVIYVDDDAAPGGNGLAWATAYQYLQDAIQHAAAAGGPYEIRVAQGAYWPDADAVTPGGTGDRTATFALGTEMFLRGGYAGIGSPTPDHRDPPHLPTVLIGDLFGNDAPEPVASGFAGYGENSYHVVTVTPGPASLIDGVVITGGNATGVETLGGGVLILPAPGFGPAEVTIHSSLVYGNLAVTGGGLCLSDPTDSTELVVAESRFIQNGADSGGAIELGSFYGRSAIRDSSFVRNVADSGGAISASGWGTQLRIERTEFRDSEGSAISTGAYTLTELVDVSFVGNAGMYGGAFYSGWESDVRMWNCSFRRNEALEGGAIFNYGGIPKFEMMNCELVGNYADTRGGAMSCLDSNVMLANCTVVGTEAEDCDVVNCILFFNKAASGFGPQIGLGEDLTYGSWTAIDLKLEHTDLEGGVPDVHVSPLLWNHTITPREVVDEDPRFVDQGISWLSWSYDSVELSAASPCRDGGDNALVRPDVFDLDGDGDTIEPTPFDFAGGDRFVATLGPDAVVDHGAFERQRCDTDLDGDGKVGFSDLSMLLVQWGPCSGCAADIDADGVVGYGDLPILLALWGPC
jgi:hypothetical protein